MDYCSACGKSLVDPQQFCPRCGANLVSKSEPPKQVQHKLKTGPIVLMLLGFLVALVTVVSMLTDTRHGNPPIESDTRYLAHDTLGTVRFEDIGYTAEAVRGKDTEAFQALVESGRVVELPRSSRVTLVDYHDWVAGDGMSLVIIESGSAIGKRLYVPSRELSVHDPWRK